MIIEFILSSSESSFISNNLDYEKNTIESIYSDSNQ